MMSLKVGFENLPAPIVSHLRDAMTMRHAQPHVYHVTELIRCLRLAWYRRTYPEQVKWSVKSLLNIYRGSIYDARWTPLFKVHQKNYRAKRRGVTITGTLDFVYEGILYDLKMPTVITYKKIYGAGQGYRRQVQAYLSLAHANGELLDVHRARVLMVAGDVVVEEVAEWTDMLDSWPWPRAFLLDSALNSGDPSLLVGPEESWECREEFCPADVDFRIKCAYQGRDLESPLRVSMGELPY